ncbi:MAG: hypothetical protein WC410_00330 [Candidatus Paceibacterota bacterium]|jgi:hypothetical protein|nr:hypothetical protein [Candidatus Paceibacterota bacterium]
MEAIQKTKEFIGFLDLDPKFLIVEGPSDSMAVLSVHSYEGCYRLNVYFYEEFDFCRKTQPLEISVKAVRLRAQAQKPELELFPCVDVEKVGFLRARLVNLDPEEESLEEIDAEIIALIARKLWAKKPSFLPLIKTLLPLDASEIIRKTAVFFPRGL